MKKGKELKVEKFKNYTIVFGSVNNRHSKALYINISAWAEPKLEGDVNYKRAIRDSDKKIRQTIYNEIDANQISPFIKNRTIIDYDIRESGVRYGKRSFVSCEITLFMKQEAPVNSQLLISNIDDLINVIIDNVFEKNRNFRFYKKKTS